MRQKNEWRADSEYEKYKDIFNGDEWAIIESKVNGYYASPHYSKELVVSYLDSLCRTKEDLSKRAKSSWDFFEMKDHDFELRATRIFSMKLEDYKSPYEPPIFEMPEWMDEAVTKFLNMKK